MAVKGRFVESPAHRRPIDRRRRRDGEKEDSTMKALATLTLTGLLVTGGLASGAAADPVGKAAGSSQPTAIERLVRQEDARRNDLQLGITRATQIVPIPPAPRIQVVSRDGFDWLDAAIGAAAGVAALTALTGATLVARSGQPRPLN
jgi:hypothetical protein